MKFLVAVLGLTFASGSALYASDTCMPMGIEYFSTVNDKVEMEAAMIALLPQYRKGDGTVDWPELMRCFQALGDRYTAEFLPGGGGDGADVYRFNLDRTNFLTPFISVPGASNGVYTAIFLATDLGDVAIVPRGGEPRWLKLE